MITATAQAAPNIAFIKYRLAKLGRTNGKVYFGGEPVARSFPFQIRFLPSRR
jgi:hypothetical protein